MNIMLIILIAISLSMDAFSLSLAYGTVINKKNSIKLLSIIVGLYHFFMPIIGLSFGKFILNYLPINEKTITLIIFVIIGFNMIIDSFKKEKNIKALKLFEMFMFGFAVSIDSFSIGIGLNNITNNYIICPLIFSITSLIFTYIGLLLGNKINEYLGTIAPIIGGIMLILLGIIYIIKV